MINENRNTIFVPVQFMMPVLRLGNFYYLFDHIYKRNKIV